jgi:phosphopantothenoylcysteine decarboxylase/phosphopantothenate--cysteine ligase
MLRNKKILLGVCGSIAAYKAAGLTRLLIKQGAEVQIIMSASASDFITPLTLATLSKKPVLTEYFNRSSGLWHNHVELGLWADIMLIAPASANTIGKMANGICDNLLTATYLSARCPVVLAPAMDLDMYAHPSTINNLAKLKSYGNYIIDAEYGELASGLTGKGRMAEPEHVVEYLENFLSGKPLQGKQVMVTAGPTYEPIDPVRFIGNHSTGKMGYALAEQLARQGAQVTLISGPSALPPIQHPQVKTIKVTTATQMCEESLKAFPNMDIAVMAAAVADYTPAQVADKKIKKSEATFDLTLTKTKDIASELGKIKLSRQLLVGFALETNDEIANARKKIASKNLDFIILNSLNDPGAGFKHDTNKITVIDKDNNITSFELKQKEAVALDIVNIIIQKLNA